MSSSRHEFTVIDSHTGGNPTRLVLTGVPTLPGDSVAAKAQYFKAHHDWIRTAMVLEPRGGNLTSSAVLVPPSHSDADIGIFFMEPMGYVSMCGSDTIGLVTMLIDSGTLPSSGGQTVVRIDTPAGLVEATARMNDGLVEDVTFVNVPAFVAALDVELDVEGHGRVTVDVAYGGNVYVIVDARRFGLDLVAERTAPAVDIARRVLAGCRRHWASEPGCRRHWASEPGSRHRGAGLPATLGVGAGLPATSGGHPDDPAIRGITHVQFASAPVGEDADARIMVVIEPGIVDRSPCGTGTTAKIATLSERGLLGLGDPYTHESVTGQTFTGRLVGQTVMGGRGRHTVAITGRAFVTAEATMIVDSRDPLGHGFLVT